MKLAALIRSGGIAAAANANPANSANEDTEQTGSLAELATFALATVAGSCTADLSEFESVLAYVGPAYRTPAYEYEEIREAAGRDLPSALIAYRELARQIKGK